MVLKTMKCEFNSHQAYELPDGVMGNTSDFDSGVLSSNLSPVTNGVFSLSGKAPSCDGGEQGSIPGDNQRNIECKMQNEEGKKAAFVIAHSLFTMFLAYRSTDQDTALRTQR